jgi:serine/threonine protein phosphatase PrpC
MSEAFLVTDIEFLKKAKAENLSSGTTALCAIYRKTQKKLYVGWCGDSQALIAKVGNVHQIVRKHSPEDESERKRIEALGGVVLYWSDSYRVNGMLAVSRAIGDAAHKPYVSAEPEIAVLDLDGDEDFFVMGCDGLWDSLSEDDIAITCYKKLRENPGELLSTGFFFQNYNYDNGICHRKYSQQFTLCSSSCTFAYVSLKNCYLLKQTAIFFLYLHVFLYT